jgi:hypothetical protein
MAVFELLTLCIVEMTIKTSTTENPATLLYGQIIHIFMKLHSDLFIYLFFTKHVICFPNEVTILLTVMT